jgi:glucosylceramidase
MNRRGWIACAVAALAMWAGGGSKSLAVDIWVTTGDKSRLLQQQSDAIFQAGAGSGGTAVNIDGATTYQTVVGFGGAMTDSSAWLMQNDMSATQRDKLMRQLFSPQSGIGLNYLRVPIGASDFTATGGFYTYDDNPPGGTDPTQNSFSVAHDDAYIIPRLQQAMALNPALKLMASPWSAPAWMKTNHLLTGGSLATQWEGAYADYLAKFVQAYSAKGLPIDTLSLQNEPLNSQPSYPTMTMTATQQVDLIKNYVGPTFAAQGINTKILAYDHNWDNTAFPEQVLADPDASKYVAGTAFHAYAGNVSAQTTVHNAYPDKDIYFTEITGGSWAPNFSDNLVWNFQNIIIGNMQNWGKNALFWNLALDPNGDPHLGGCSGCRGIVSVDTTTGAVTFGEEFYTLGQVTRGVQPGAVRIGSTSSASLNTVAFRNPDGSRALIALNPNATATTARVTENGQHFNYPIPGNSVATFLWNGTGADFDNGGFDDGGFQQGDGSLDAWTVFGNAIGNVSSATQAVLTGDKSLKLYGQFNNQSNTAGVFQSISVAAGDRIVADLSALVRSADSIAGTNNSAQMKIEFYNLYGGAAGSVNFLGQSLLTIADGTSANDVWLNRELIGIAPAGAVEARLVLQFLQPNNQGGAVHIDSVTFGVNNVAPLAGDYDGNGIVDAADYTVWRDTLGQTGIGLAADGTGPGGVPDGVVDQLDYDFWKANFGNHSGSGAGANAAVPEPTTLLMLLVGLVTFGAIRQQKCRKLI